MWEFILKFQLAYFQTRNTFRSDIQRLKWFLHTVNLMIFELVNLPVRCWILNALIKVLKAKRFNLKLSFRTFYP